MLRALGRDWVNARGRRREAYGFTLIELLVVVALIAIATATVSLSLRDPAAAQLEREAERLTALFETARAESRAAGLPVQWAPTKKDSADHFQFVGLPKRVKLPQRWLGEPIAVQIAGANFISLGPEPMIGAQRLQLSLGSQQIVLTTDGMSAFEVTAAPAP
ncbi:prepilin-type N-terminal cleavage/methylation domain-containing protein [Paucibacter sp. B2R-40]|uniref:pilus assembly FimT family protein n=1 Tax=Paucibacter sp. B2R-40 TaxID=2893554 RepID=UPI0021E370B0|nr:prepilin-type N-terminal cleavage/methylation domain-containing protein [Paucibacter sp. B2R-40]MCV2356166.1 prepilin-type N-terminal cleavage/methylation domain-containing protein [Paucibacter sp. B2R-40]